LKRAELVRKTPLRTGPSTLRRTSMVRKAPLRSGLPQSREELAISRRKTYRTLAKVKLTSKRVGYKDPKYLAWVRTHPCCACGAFPPNHAHHETLGGRGKSQKAPDSRSLPLCFRCHDDFHLVRGRFKGWTKQQRRDFQDVEITRLRAIWAGIQDHGVAQEPIAEAV
jgi:hypothetical protein